MAPIKEDSVPFTPSEIGAVREGLLHVHDHRVLDRAGKRYLFIRAAGDHPDVVHDLERALEDVPSWCAYGLEAVFVLGARGDLHIPSYTVLPALEMRDRLDAELAQDARARLDVHYGSDVMRVRGDPRGLRRLRIRVPRERVVEVSEPDLVAIADALGPSLDAGRLRDVRLCLLVAEADHLRFRAVDFLADVGTRWSPRRPAAPSMIPARKRVLNAEALFDVEVQLDAVDDETALRLQLQRARLDLETVLEHHGFRTPAPRAAETEDFPLFAERRGAYPRRVAARTYPHLSRADAEDLLRRVRDLNLDQAYALAPLVDPDAARLLATSRVKVLRPEEVGSLVP